MAALDWFAPDAVAEPVPAPARRRPRPAAAPRKAQRSSRRRLTGGILWMAAFALLLTGVVAMNVAVLRANMRADRLDKQTAELQAQNSALASQVSAAGAAPRIEAAARRLGLVPAPAEDTSYLDLGQK